MSNSEARAQPEASGLGRRVVRGVAWSQIGILVQTGLLFLFSVLVARAFAPAEKGVFDVYTALMGVLVLISQLGLNFALMKFAPEAGTPLDAPRRRALLLRMVRDRLIVVAVVGGVLALLHTALAELLAFPLLTSIWGLVVLALLGNQVLDIALAALQAGLRLRAFWALQSLRVALNIAGLALWVVVTNRIAPQNLIALMAVTSLFSAGVGLAYALRVNPPAPPGATLALPSQKEVYRLALGAWLVGVTAFALSNQSDLLLINLLLRDTAQVAYYNIAYLLSSQLIAVLGGWAALVVPAFAAAIERRGEEGVRRSWLPFVYLHWLTFTPALLMLARLSPWAVELLFGAAYLPAVPLLSLMAALYAVAFLPTALPYYLFLAAGQTRLMLLARAGGGVLNVLLNVGLIPLLGVWGTVLATTLSAGVTLAVEGVLAWRKFGVTYAWAFLLRVLIASVAAAASTLWIEPWFLFAGASWSAQVFALILSLMQGGAVYVALLKVLRPFNQADLDAFAPLPLTARRLLSWFARPIPATR